MDINKAIFIKVPEETEQKTNNQKLIPEPIVYSDDCYINKTDPK